MLVLDTCHFIERESHLFLGEEKKNPIMCLQTVDFYSHKENTAKLREEKPSFFDRREKKHTMCCVTIHFCGQNEHYCNFHTEVFSNIKSKNKSKFCLFIFPFSSITSTTFYYFSFSLLSSFTSSLCSSLFSFSYFLFSSFLETPLIALYNAKRTSVTGKKC